MASPDFRLAIIGDPVAHSLSPAMHEAALRELGLSGSYERIRVKKTALSGLVSQLRRKGYSGFNVTIPHKAAVLSLLENADEQSRRIGAVNTVHRSDGGFRGRNTDASGFARLLDAYKLSPGCALVLGAGGAAKACIDVLSETRWSVSVANRSTERMRSLRGTSKIDLNDGSAVQEAIDQVDLVVNATPVGLNHPDESPLPDRITLKRRPTVIDLVYVPLDTRLLIEAREAGCPSIDGLTLLAAQAADSFEIWTGHRLSDEFFRQAALDGALLSRATTFHFGQFGPPG